MVDIFSSLDYYSDSGIDYFVVSCSYLGFMFGGLAFYQYKVKFWVMDSGLSLTVLGMLGVVFQVVVDCKGGRFGGLGLGHVSVFCSLICLNFSGMVPGGFSVTSQLSVGLVFGLVWWFWSVMSGCFFSCSKFLAHLLPLGTPGVLCPLMVLIETVSILIRPVTLAVRLVANITMGHLVLSLMGDKMVGIGSLVVGVYVLFEFFVCALQAYVFTLLVSLYSSDHPGE
uniref:ATP synthase subunit a n=1 Tax=Quadrula quadrula TaxID=52372 RepID=D2DW02_QUAQU|nr:ATP synthase F0 subunit 6 [Quadrula quadrula]